jgi:DNA invertase Pin-like site-specific DNA recombinase
MQPYSAHAVWQTERPAPACWIDMGGTVGPAIVVIDAIAEFERNLIVERGLAGMRRATLGGRHIGRRLLGGDSRGDPARSPVRLQSRSGRQMLRASRTLFGWAARSTTIRSLS